MLPRRYLPSLSQLSAFEAAARLGSFTRAAQELDLTQSAVSRQIGALERLLGAALFERDRQRVSLTPQGDAYAREVRAGLRQIGNASLSLATNPHGGALTLAILPAFGTRWLAPRLAGFLGRHPGVTVNLTTRMDRFDFDAEQIDAAIDFGRRPRPGAEAAFLMEERVIPCARADLLERLAISRPADLLRAPLLHMAPRPRAWARWLRAQGVEAEPPHGVVFDQFATMAQAAVHGLGVGLLPDFLAEDDLRAGRLHAAFDLPVTSVGAYRLVWPASRASYPPLVAFRDWILAEVAAGAAG
jgi:LysR family transcriptional regulator, glycine cleavage system transcriptional activator